MISLLLVQLVDNTRDNSNISTDLRLAAGVWRKRLLLIDAHTGIIRALLSHLWTSLVCKL
jgi:hypothetical protein